MKEKIRILIVEDEVIIADSIYNELVNLGYDPLEPALNYEEAIHTLDNEIVDIVILDIQLVGRESGIDIGALLNDKYNLPFIFLTSNSDQFTVSSAIKVNPYAFVIKPFTKEELFSSIELALNKYRNEVLANKNKENDYLFVKSRDVVKKIKFDDIVFIKSDHVYLELNILENQKELIRASFNEIQSKLPNTFIRVHKSYIINENFINTIDKKELLINNSIPIGKIYKKNILKKIE